MSAAVAKGIGQIKEAKMTTQDKGKLLDVVEHVRHSLRVRFEGR